MRKLRKRRRYFLFYRPHVISSAVRDLTSSLRSLLCPLQYKWWEQQEAQGAGVKWTSLEHQGVLFPPPYEPLPKSVKMRYDGQRKSSPPQPSLTHVSDSRP
jgi:hypothetical protein